MKLIVDEGNRGHVMEIDSIGKMNKHFNAFLDNDVETVKIIKKCKAGNKDESYAFERSESERLEEELTISMKYWENAEVNFLLKREKYRGMKEGFVIGAITTGLIAIAIILIL